MKKKKSSVPEISLYELKKVVFLRAEDTNQLVDQKKWSFEESAFEFF